MQGVCDSALTKRATGRGMTGKGDRPRPGFYSQEYRQNHERIFGKKKKKGTLSAGVEGEVSLPPVVPDVNGVAFPKNK